MNTDDQASKIPDQETGCPCTRCDALAAKGRKRHRVNPESFGSVIVYPAVTISLAGCRCPTCQAALVDAGFAALADIPLPTD